MSNKARSYFDRVGHDREGISDWGPSLAVQSSKEECDINVIIKKYLRTGELPGLRQGAFADIAECGNLHEALETVAKAEEAFDALPADVRKFFDNDPVKMVAFAENVVEGSDQYKKALELGLIDPPKRKDPVPPAVEGGAPGTPGA